MDPQLRDEVIYRKVEYYVRLLEDRTHPNEVLEQLAFQLGELVPECPRYCELVEWAKTFLLPKIDTSGMVDPTDVDEWGLLPWFDKSSQ